MKNTKTKKCKWCEKRKKVENMEYIGTIKDTEYWICIKCNFEYDVI